MAEADETMGWGAAFAAGVVATVVLVVVTILLELIAGGSLPS